MAEVGWASLGIVPTFDRGFDRDLARGVDPALGRVGRSSGKRFGGILGKAAVAGAAGAIGAGFAAFKLGKDSVGLASDLNESLNAVNVSYDDQARAVRKLGREAARSLGLSNTEFNSLAVRFSSFSKTIAGKGGKAVTKTLDDLTTRASDFASVMNLEVNEAAELFQSGLAGETEPLRRYGLDLSAAAVTAHAYKEGIAEAGDELTEQEKIQARYSLLMQQTNKTQGDFKNTSGELANQQRILGAEWDNARAKLGSALLPVMKDAVGFVLDEGIPAFEDFSDWFTSKGIPAIGDFADRAKPLANEVLPALGTTLDVAKDALEIAAPLAKDFVGYFNDMPKWAQTAIVGGGAGLLAFNKLKPEKGGLGSGVLGSIKPVPVFVTNMGGGLGADVGGGKGKGKRGGKLPFIAGSSPLLLPLALGGDSAPGQGGDRPAANKGYLRLLEMTGTESGEALHEALLDATSAKLREYRKTLREELDVNFRDIGKINFESGNDALPGGSLVRDARRREREGAETFATTFEIKPTKGQTRAERDFLRLIGYKGDIEGKPITPEIRLLGLPAAEADLARFQAKLDQIDRSLDKFYRQSGGSPEGIGGVTVNYNAPVNYTDDATGRKRAQQRDRRANLSGVTVP